MSKYNESYKKKAQRCLTYKCFRIFDVASLPFCSSLLPCKRQPHYFKCSQINIHRERENEGWGERSEREIKCNRCDTCSCVTFTLLPLIIKFAEAPLLRALRGKHFLKPALKKSPQASTTTVTLAQRKQSAFIIWL